MKTGLIIDAEFRKRIKEVDYFFSSLDSLYTFFDQKQSRVLKTKIDGKTLKHSDFMVMLKSNALLMLYNLIESTVRTFIQNIYDEITLQELEYTDIRQELQKIWVDVSYDTLGYTTTNFDQHKDKAKEMIGFVINKERVALTEKSIKLNGNVDIRVIKELFKNHGVKVPTDHGSNVGAGLNTIKQKRNTIAHGNLSFIDSGRDVTLEDLKVYKNEIIDYLTLLNESITDYITEKEYRF